MAAGLDIECYIDKLSNGLNALIVHVTATDRVAYGSEASKVIIGISYNQLNELYVRKTYMK